MTDVARRDLLLTVAPATAGALGAAFLDELVRRLGPAMEAAGAWVTEEHGHVLARWPQDAPDPAPGEGLWLAAHASDGTTLGHLVLGVQEDLDELGRTQIGVFVSRVGTELERRIQESRLRERETELLVSRARVLQAGDEERRRIGRDLHDGVQQHLVALVQRLDLARRALADPARAGGLLDEAREQAQAIMADLRELSRGLHPSGLSERGLRGALELMNARGPLPVRIARLPQRRLPDPVELTVFYLVSEALTNATRYAQATALTVTTDLSARALLVEIADDGVGGADVGAGSGLRGLGDRVTALGGSLEVHSPPGGGTRIVADIPLAPFRDAREPFIEFGYEGDGGQGERMIAQVVEGTKRAAISLNREWELEGGTPRIGTLLPVQDHHGRRHTTVRVSQTTVVPFRAVDAAMATAAMGTTMTAQEWQENRRAFYAGCRDEIAVVLGEPDWRLTDDEPMAVVWFEVDHG